MSAIRSIPVITVCWQPQPANDLTLVTRNDRAVAGLGAMVLNPFRGSKNSP